MTRTDSSLYQNIRIVLVNTSHPGNIGAVARAMKNMGLSELVLVEPREYPCERAEWRAASAQDLLANARVVSTLDEALENCALVIGTSARGRKIPWPLFNPRECGQRAAREAAEHPVAIMFGREDRGLTNEELHKCHYHVNIPTSDSYTSLNLGMAVQVISYEIRMAIEYGENQATDEGLSAQKTEGEPGEEVPKADHQSVESFFGHLEQVMTDVNFHDPDNPRQTFTRLRRLFNRKRMDKMELGILRGFLTAIEQKLKK